MAEAFEAGGTDRAAKSDAGIGGSSGCTHAWASDTGFDVCGAIGFVKMTDQANRYLMGMMIIMAFYMIGRTVNTIIINGIFAAGGDTLFDMYSLAVCMWGIAVPLAAAGTFFLNWPVLVVYACTCLDEVGKIPWVMYHYRKYKWVKDLTR